MIILQAGLAALIVVAVLGLNYIAFARGSRDRGPLF